MTPNNPSKPVPRTVGSGEGATRARTCHFCRGPIPDDEKAMRAKTGDAWAHFECWYDGSPFKRDAEGRLLNVA